MKRINILFLFSLLIISCSTGNDKPVTNSITSPIERTSSIIVAEGIIYDVIIMPQSEEDEWENERLKGYHGSQMISSIFDAIYNNEVKVFDYFTGNSLSVSDIRKMEKREGFERSKIGKIQFTENWYFNRETLQIEKEIVSIVPGYESRSSDGMIISYKAAFRLDYTEAPEGN